MSQRYLEINNLLLVFCRLGGSVITPSVINCFNQGKRIPVLGDWPAEPRRKTSESIPVTAGSGLMSAAAGSAHSGVKPFRTQREPCAARDLRAIQIAIATGERTGPSRDGTTEARHARE